MFNIISHQRNANQNQNEILALTHLDGQKKKQTENECGQQLELSLESFGSSI